MTNEISFRSIQSVEQNRPVSSSDAMRIVKRMEMTTGLDIINTIKTMIFKNNADSVSISKDVPRSVVYIRRSLGDVSVSLERGENEIRVSIPQSSIDTPSTRD